MDTTQYSESELISILNLIIDNTNETYNSLKNKDEIVTKKRKFIIKCNNKNK